MEHKITIWSRLKERNKNGKFNHIIEGKEVITENDINDLALKKYSDDIAINSNRVYWGEIDQTTH